MFEPVAEFIVDFADDFAASFGEVVIAGSRFVNKDERGFVADTDTMDEFAFETGLFNEPGGA